eukprot:TRINITY_DN98828_c0_g1_i1.p1 TRINITY_DN98828_c0_g1~~TRINITY_DN98828_c0_g1_i1.p1  ORF type:complete len:251 (-),score=62.17 TRINITY_DN98828_c0_g1_i1:171-866(-)
MGCGASASPAAAGAGKTLLGQRVDVKAARQMSEDDDVPDLRTAWDAQGATRNIASSGGGVHRAGGCSPVPDADSTLRACSLSEEDLGPLNQCGTEANASTGHQPSQDLPTMTAHSGHSNKRESEAPVEQGCGTEIRAADIEASSGKSEEFVADLLAEELDSKVEHTPAEEPEVTLEVPVAKAQSFASASSEVNVIEAEAAGQHLETQQQGEGQAPELPGIPADDLPIFQLS